MSDVMRKTFEAAVRAEGNRRFRFIVSTTGLDRENDRILGWEVRPFLRNPVVLWSHDARTPPIARAERTTWDDERLRSTAVFPPPGVHALADTVVGLLEAGVLRAASVGFLPREWTRNNEGGFDFRLAELLEWSVVSVPANAEALAASGKSAGMDVGPILDAREAALRRCGRRTERDAVDLALDRLEWSLGGEDEVDIGGVLDGLEAHVRAETSIEALVHRALAQATRRALTPITGRLP